MLVFLAMSSAALSAPLFVLTNTRACFFFSSVSRTRSTAGLSVGWFMLRITFFGILLHKSGCLYLFCDLCPYCTADYCSYIIALYYYYHIVLKVKKLKYKLLIMNYGASMNIINPGKEDYHMHSMNYSDGMNSVFEIVYFAGKIGLNKIAITDHSQACLDAKGKCRVSGRDNINRWKNEINDVEVIFGVEGDLLNEEGDICDHLSDEPAEFLILSAHPKVYQLQSSKDTITKGYLNAIKQYHKKIAFIGHPCIKHFSDAVDIKEVIKAANDYGVAMEINGANMMNNRTDMANLDILLERADRVYVNSDAHTLHELKHAREKAFEVLREKGIKLG
ncbi:PHP domain-containing protein [Candidatus Woesearchaeota archaeon]|nr:PHP domain-containing protein [Candidatus Woesearchaeota archaeon]